MTRQLALVATLVVTLTATAVTGRAIETAQRSRFDATVTDRQTHVVRVPSGQLLTLTNVVGDVTVRRGDGPDTRVEVIRVARGRTEGDATRGLSAVEVRVSEGARGVSVEAGHEAGRNLPYSVAVSYEVITPAATEVSMTSLTGNITVSGLAAEVSAVTTTGSIEIRDTRQLVRARTTTGRVTLEDVQSDGTIEAGAIAGEVRAIRIEARRLRLDTITGPITARDIRADRVEITSTQGELSFEGRMAPDGRYDLRTHAGGITFVPLGGSGFEVRAQTVSGRVVAADGLGLAVTTRGRRDLTGTVGDGRALVLLSTFSGQVTIGARNRR